VCDWVVDYGVIHGFVMSWRRKLVRALLFCTALVMGGGALWWGLQLVERERTWQFVRVVLLGTEYGYREPVVMRWASNPTISSVFSHSDKLALLHSVTDEVNGALEGANITLVPVPNTGDITVLICSKACGERNLDTLYCDFYEGNDGLACGIGKKGSFLTESLVWVWDELSPNRQRSALLEEVVQSLGLFNDSPLYWDSLFFEIPWYAPTEKTLSSLDRRLLHFLYRYLKPGDREEDVRRAFDKHWDSIVL
jgi:hypothetical protein